MRPTMLPRSCRLAASCHEVYGMHEVVTGMQETVCLGGHDGSDQHHSTLSWYANHNDGELPTLLMGACQPQIYTYIYPSLKNKMFKSLMTSRPWHAGMRTSAGCACC